MRPYAPFNSSHTSSDFRFILILSSSGGSMPKIRESWRLPRRNAVRMSNERTVHRWLATHCKANILLSRPSVGESLGSESIRGSSYPKIINRALAFLEVPVSACSISSKDFHVSIHLDLKSWPSGTWLRKIFRTVSVAIHESISFSLAFAKSRASSGERSLIFTSTFCLLAADASRISCWSYVFPTHFWMSSSVIKISAWNTCCSTWVDMWSSSGVVWSLCPGRISKWVVPVHGSGWGKWLCGLFLQASFLSNRLPETCLPRMVRMLPSAWKGTGHVTASWGKNIFNLGCLWCRMSWLPDTSQWSSRTPRATSSSSVSAGTGVSIASCRLSPWWGVGGIIGSASGCTSESGWLSSSLVLSLGGLLMIISGSGFRSVIMALILRVRVIEW